MLPAQVARFIARHHMMAPGDRVAVAVSGGSDSVALLLLLRDLAPSLGLQLSVFHVNHQLRPSASADQAFVDALARELGFEFRACTLDAAQLVLGNLEEEARRQRYAHFERLLREGTATRVATGHTADDQAETVLLRLLRGSGTRGLSGIWPVVSLSATGRTGPLLIVRPLLGVRRAALREWLSAQGRSWREDPTNLDRNRLRNRIRHDLFPTLLRDYNPSLTEVLAGTAEIARAEEEYGETIAASVAERIWRPAPTAVAADATPPGGRSRRGPAGNAAPGCWTASPSELATLPLALRRRVLRWGIARARGDLHRVHFGHIEQLIEWIDARVDRDSCAASAPPQNLTFASVTACVSSHSVTLTSALPASTSV